VPLCINALATGLLFKLHPVVRPAWRDLMHPRLDRELIGIGLRLLAIQIAAAMIFSSTPILLGAFRNTTEVAAFNIVNRLYLIFGVPVTVIMATLPPAITDTLASGDFVWLRNAMRTVAIGTALISVIILIYASATPFLGKLLSGNQVGIPLSLGVLTAFSTVISTVNGTMGALLTGAGYLRSWTFLALFTAVLHLPLVAFGSWFAGASGAQGAIALTTAFNTVGLIMITRYWWRHFATPEESRMPAIQS
jgi:O-antigen/teichoic acid export membrane protein